MQPAPSAGKWAPATNDWFGFASHWLRKWREFRQPITEQSKAKPKQTLFSGDTGRDLFGQKFRNFRFRRQMEQYFRVISKTLVNLSRLSTFPKYRNYREFSVPFGISFRSDRHTPVSFPDRCRRQDGGIISMQSLLLHNG